MTPEELVRASLDLEARFLEALGEQTKADAVRHREPAEPAHQPHPPFLPGVRMITALGENAGRFTGEPGAWNSSLHAIEPPGSSLFTDHFGRLLPHFPTFVMRPAEEPASSEDS